MRCESRNSRQEIARTNGVPKRNFRSEIHRHLSRAKFLMVDKDAYYFSHDAGARNDERMLIIRSQYDWQGYGWYFAILEMMRESSDYTLYKDFQVLQHGLNISNDRFQNFFEECFRIGLFEEKNGRFFSSSFISRMLKFEEVRRKRRYAGRKGGKALANAKALLKQSSGNAKTSKVKESKVKESKVNHVYSEFISRFNLLTSKQCRGDSKSEKQFNARLKDGYTLEQITQAVTNCLQDEFHKQNPHYLTPEFITRVDKLEKYINYQKAPNKNTKDETIGKDFQRTL